LIRPFSIGRLECLIISDGQPEPPFEPRLEDFFTPESGVAEQELQGAATREGNGRTALTLGYNCLLVNSEIGWTVIDPGLGAKFRGYGPDIEAQVGHLGSGLREAGLNRDSISTVLLTHLHQDHTRGAIWSGEPTFPQASALAHASEVAYWSNTPASSTAAPHVGCASAAIRLLATRLHTFDYGTEVVPGIRAIDAAGHTPGHTAFLVESRDMRLLCVGDSFYDPLQVSNPRWRTPWDHETESSVRSRRRMLERAANEDLLVHAYHLPFPGVGVVRRHGDAYTWSAVAQL
jgi:glyoxylase-like metal-dependent hydrolase (beta-lactamase superfamily II)